MLYVGNFPSTVCESGSGETRIAAPPDARLRYRKKPMAPSIAIPPAAPATVPPIASPDSFDSLFCGIGLEDLIVTVDHIVLFIHCDDVGSPRAWVRLPQREAPSFLMDR